MKNYLSLLKFLHSKIAAELNAYQTLKSAELNAKNIKLFSWDFYTFELTAESWKQKNSKLIAKKILKNYENQSVTFELNAEKIYK